MGYNIAGLVINHNYDKDINKLADDLAWDVEVIEEINLEMAASNWTPDGEFRLYFSENATMIFFPHEWVIDQHSSEKADTLNYAYSATSMAFQVDLFRSGHLVRSITEFDHQKHRQYGEPLTQEEAHPTADGLTFALMDELLGEPFGMLDLNAKAYRCRKTS